MTNMKIPKNDPQKIINIMLRAASMFNLELRGTDRLTLSMDLMACHANGCPLDLDGLLTAEASDFGHDIWGITQHINRKTGQLENCFLPRYAAIQHSMEAGS